MTPSPPDSGPTAAADAPVFIVGNDRSGTTMFRLILDRADVIAIPTESMFLGDFAPVRLGKLDLSEHATAVRFAQTVWNHPKVRLWQLDGVAPVPPEGLDHDAAYRFAVEAPYRAYAAQHGKQRWGDKTPYYLAWVDEILAVWPAARFIVLVRDGRDVALSICKMPFGANNAWAAARDWADGIRHGLAAEQRHPHSVLTLRYEDIVANPEPEVRRACEFLGVEFTPAMLEIERTDRSRIVADQAGWFENLWSGINEKSVGKWRRQMPARDQAVFAQVAGTELASLGYELGEHAAGSRPLSRPATLGYRAHHVGARVRNFVRLRIVQERGRELRYVIRRKLRQS